QKTIKDRIKLANAPQLVRDRLVARQVTIEDALALTEFADDQSVYDRLSLQLGTPNFAHVVEQARKDREWVKRAAKIEKDLTDKGIRVVTNEQLDDEVATASEKAERDPTVETFEWYEFTDEDEVPEGAERAAMPDRASDGGVMWFYKEIYKAPESGADGADATTTPPAETAAQARAREDRARKAKLDEDLRTAATVRRRFLAKAAAESNADFAVRCLRLYVMDRSTRSGMTKSAAMELLGVPPMTKDDDENDHAEIERHVNKMTLPQLAVSAYLLDNVMQEEHLANAFQWQREPYPGLEAWHHDLTEVFGYEYSDVERGLLDARDAATADAQE
ncbi:hypothetical protein CH296_27975, partial [Rhodococcus sp. 14-2496-1d]|uniref:hypothetical protein n=1 Tax=Rhodococcus sp. 14-2496-1d TaxID=2023146 RepID=UPI000BD7A8E6